MSTEPGLHRSLYRTDCLHRFGFGIDTTQPLAAQ